MSFAPSTLLRFFSSFQPFHKPCYFLLSSSLKPPKSNIPFTKALLSYMENSPPPQQPPPLLVTYGKSSSETQFAQSLKLKNTLTLPSDDGEISIYIQSFKSSETVTQESFDAEIYMNALSTHQFGRFLIWSPRLSSTQDLVAKNFQELPVGTVCIADVQFKGRGRSKNVWESPKGALLFSFTLQMEDGKIVPILQYVVCLAIVEAIKNICDENGLPYIDIRIKWPNDLYLDGVKVGGILCTSTYTEKKFNVSVGIGLNVDNEIPTTSLNKVLSELCEMSYKKLRREEILAMFFNRFENLYNIFVNQGFRALEEMYYRAWLHSEQRVVIQEKNDKDVVEEIGVTIQGLTTSGYLLAIDDDSQLYELHPDGNSFDFFKGLVRKKLE